MNTIALNNATLEESLRVAKYSLRHDPNWHGILADAVNTRRRGLHLGVFVEPYLSLIIDGRKTVESRFAAVRQAPFERVARGDLVFLKRAGGPVVGICEIGAAWFYHLDKRILRSLKVEFTKALCANEPGFWTRRSHASFATLMYVARVASLSPMIWPKRDRRGWVTLREHRPSGTSKPEMKTTVVAFSGRIASGKSTLSAAFASSMGCPRVGFGDFLRTEAARRRLGQDRDTLQAIGEEWVAADPDGLCRAVLGRALWQGGSALVIDGVRHVGILDRLTTLVSPSPLKLIHVSTPEEIRIARLQSRGENATLLSRHDAHSTEHDVTSELPRRADLLLDGSEALEQLVQTSTEWARHLP